MNVQAEVAAAVLDFYKAQNSRRPLVVEAKGRDDGGSGFSGGGRGGYS
jgi:hypothetical protein